ncbi:MAG: Trm112 family protein [Gemmatimonadetes bacterium]|nr:Trm112 family protein [Gemmatimonadota bacterium]
MSIDPKLLEILVCPKCRGELEHSESEQTLTCHQCRLRYRIEDDIPIMLIDEAEAI